MSKSRTLELTGFVFCKLLIKPFWYHRLVMKHNIVSYTKLYACILDQHLRIAKSYITIVSRDGKNMLHKDLKNLWELSGNHVSWSQNFLLGKNWYLGNNRVVQRQHKFNIKLTTQFNEMKWSDIHDGRFMWSSLN